MIGSLIVIAIVTGGNLALGFVVATVFGHGPQWATRLLPRALQPSELKPAEAAKSAH